LAKLDKFDLIILDDITYAHKDQAETGVFFELIARRYEYRSIAVSLSRPINRLAVGIRFSLTRP